MLTTSRRALAASALALLAGVGCGEDPKVLDERASAVEVYEQIDLGVSGEVVREVKGRDGTYLVELDLDAPISDSDLSPPPGFNAQESSFPGDLAVFVGTDPQDSERECQIRVASVDDVSEETTRISVWVDCGLSAS